MPKPKSMSKLIYFADLTHCGTITNADTFPLGIGSIAAYAKRRFGDLIDVDLFKFPDDLNAALLRQKPDILCLSNYTWSSNLTLEFAKFVRAEYPETIIIMGGPNISLSAEERQNFLHLNDCIDFYIKFEGELAFAELLDNLLDCKFELGQVRERGEAIGNLLFLSDGQLVEGPEKRVSDLSQLPSPYTMGLMDKFFNQGLRPLVEFARGCPYACTFCTDSLEHKNKVMRRDQAYVDQELNYIRSRITHASDLIIADLNFGMYQEDVAVAKVLRETIDTYGWPKMITASPGKSQPERIAQVTRIINGEDKGVIKFGASMQSTAPSVLKNIKRKNLPIEKIDAIVGASDYERDFTEYFTELIVGLPNDTKETHYQSLREMIDEVGMNVINVHQLALLQGAPMSLPGHGALYGFDVRHRVLVGCIGEYEIGRRRVPVAEIEDVVVATDTMSHAEWLECRAMNLLVKIYIDRDYFAEVFGLVRRLGLSAVDLLETLRCDVIPKYPSLNHLIDQFVLKTKEPLFENKSQLEDFVGMSRTVDQYKNGVLGGNEMLIYRAKAYLECNEDLHLALVDAAQSYFQEKGMLTDLMSDYIRQAAAFSQLRKFNPLNFTQELSGGFDYDFIASRKRAFRTLPEESAGGHRKVRFFFNDHAKSEIEYAIRTWVIREGTKGELSVARGGFESLHTQFETDALTKFNFGKLFHYGNLRVLNRSVEYLN